MKANTEVRRKIAAYSMSRRHHPDDVDSHNYLRAEYLTEQLIVTIKHVLTRADFTPDQRHRIAAAVMGSQS